MQQRIKDYILKRYPNHIPDFPEAINHTEIEAVDVLTEMRFGDKKQTWYENNALLGAFQFASAKSNNIVWNGCCFTASTRMVVSDNGGATWNQKGSWYVGLANKIFYVTQVFKEHKIVGDYPHTSNSTTCWTV